MKEDWDAAIAFVLNAEGGYTLDPNDPGGETKYGISKKAYPSVDIKNLTMQQAMEIYHKDYWLPCSGDDLPTGFAIATFDCGVNQGTTKAKRLLQMALEVEVDGVIGIGTLTAAAKAAPWRVKRLLSLRLAEYARLMHENPNLLVFAVDWFYRVISLSKLLFELEGKNDGRK